MKRMIFFAVLFASCGAPYEQARIEAFGMRDLHEPSESVQKMELCI